MDMINVETGDIRWSAHTPDYPAPWVDLRVVDLSAVIREGETLARDRDHLALQPRALWGIEPSKKGQYKARMKTEEELRDPVAEKEAALRQLREAAAEEIRVVIEADVDPDLLEIVQTGRISLADAEKKGDDILPILADYKSEKAALESVTRDVEKIL